MKISSLAILFLSAMASIEATADEYVQEACDVNNPTRSLRDVISSRKLLATTIIDNGVIMLGIQGEGNLNVDTKTVEDGWQPSLPGTGLKFLRDDGKWYDSTAYGCACEGFGVSAKKLSDGTSFSGGSNLSVGGVQNLFAQPITTNGIDATTVADVTTGPLKVTHEFTPSSTSANLYKVLVTLENTSPTETLTELRYRRSMDWDIPDTTFSECVSVFYGTQPDSLEYVNDNGFLPPNPLVDASLSGLGFSCPTGGAPCPVFDSGPADHGSTFQFLFKEDDGVTNVSLNPNETFEFKIFYGAAPNKDAADAAIGLVGTEIVSYGYPSQSGCSDESDGSPGVYIFGFGDVGGDPIIKTRPPTSSPTMDCENNLEPFTIEFSCEELVQLSGSSQRELCENGIIYENCPGLCDPKLCPCENNPFPFEIKKGEFTLCDEIAALPPAQQIKKCKKKTVYVNCPDICECNPLGPCDDNPLPFEVGTFQMQLCANIAALGPAQQKKQCRNKLVRQQCPGTCVCDTPEPTMKPTVRPTKDPCEGDNLEPFTSSSGEKELCAKIADLPPKRKRVRCKDREVQKNCPCTCPDPCLGIDSAEPFPRSKFDDVMETCANIASKPASSRIKLCKAYENIAKNCPCTCPPTPAPTPRPTPRPTFREIIQDEITFIKEPETISF